MRTKFVISIFSFVAIFVAAADVVPIAGKKDGKDSVGNAAIKDSDTVSIRDVDTLALDSLQLAIYKHNKAIDDSIRLDSINRSKKNGIDAGDIFRYGFHGLLCRLKDCTHFW